MAAVTPVVAGAGALPLPPLPADLEGGRGPAASPTGVAIAGTPGSPSGVDQLDQSPAPLQAGVIAAASPTPSGEAAEAVGETGNYLCCSSLCVQQVGTTFGVAVLIGGVALTIFGALTSNPMAIAFGATAMACGIVIIYLSRKYIGLDVEVSRLKAENNRLAADITRLSGELATFQRLNQELQVESERFAKANEDHAALLAREREQNEAVIGRYTAAAAHQEDIVTTLQASLQAAQAASATERAAAAAELTNLRQTHAEVVAHLTEALTAASTTHTTALTASATTVGDAATRVDTAATRLLAAVTQFGATSDAYLALQRDLAAARTRNQQLTSQLTALKAQLPPAPNPPRSS